MVQQPSYWKVLTRRKPLAQESGDGDSKLNRILGLYDLTALGVGSTLGAGVYVLAGQIAKDQAGPSVMISFAIAALASLLAGICYAEFGARVPKAGSAYVYSYVCIGEFAAFVIGWNLILEYIIGTASVCRGISLYLDTMINDTLKTTFAEVAPMNVSFLGSYFDFFAFGLVVVFGVALAFGVETSTMANNFCTILNLSILLFVIVAGAIKANFDNWSIDASNATNVPDGTDVGMGGFFPFGFTGTLKGAATCFFGFVGFDCIATTGEEVRNPRKNIPRSILLSLLVIFLCYCGVSTVLTLMVPYYLQDINAPLPSAFKAVGWSFAMWIVSVGGLVGLLASLFGALFPLPRVMYSMAQDGLMFRFLGKIHPKYRVPVRGSIFAAMLTALIAGLFDLAQLVNLLSIGTLLAYSVVAISITILRYMDNSETLGTEEVIGENGIAHVNGHVYSNGNSQNLSESTLLTSKGERATANSVFRQLFNLSRAQVPTELSTRIVGSLITVFCFLSMGIGLIFMQAYDALITNQLWVLVLLIVLVIFTGLVLLIICLQPRETFSRVFRVPLVPIVPAISIFINIFLMLQLDVMTWIRFGVWMVIGIPMFVACWCMYDIRNPANRHPDRLEFERMLKASLNMRSASSSSLDVVDHKTADYAHSSTATTAVMQQNERSIRSYDEIRDMNEVSDDLREVKHPNGQICYVEDNRSDESNNGSGPGKDENYYLKHPGTNKGDTSEEEKSAIAMLDDILQTEDDKQTDSSLFTSYDRKISVDSEMLPCVTRSTTVATVHSSNNSENDLNESKEDISYPTSEDSGIEIYREKQRMANELVEDILNSPQLWQALEQHNLRQHQMYSETPETSKTLKSNSDSVRSSFAEEALDNKSHSQSVESLVSASSIDDPMHSEKFRNKLALLMMKPPENKITKENDGDGGGIVQEPRPKLKHSKSEVDIRHWALKANEIPKEGESSTPADSAQVIPKPPKFDPVLYKTINSFGTRTRERPGLDRILKSDTLSKPAIIKEVSEPQLPTEELPFKQQLEALLKRGPSHKSQQKPNVEVRRPKSVDRPSQIPAHEPVERKNFTKSQSNLNIPSPIALEEARKTLRSIKHKSNILSN